MSDEIRRLSYEIQGPLIEQHLDSDAAADMSLEEVTEFISQFYTDEDRQAWKDVEAAGLRTAARFQVMPQEISQDIWTFVAESSNPNQTHH